MANNCELKRVVTDDGTGGGTTTKYYLQSQDFDDDTYMFSDRPIRHEDTFPTEQFFKDFEIMFDEGTGGSPNAAITFDAADDRDRFEGTLYCYRLSMTA